MPGAVDDPDGAMAALYQLPLGEFVAARDQLAATSAPAIATAPPAEPGALKSCWSDRDPQVGRRIVASGEDRCLPVKEHRGC